MKSYNAENKGIAKNKLNLNSSLFFKIILENAQATSILILDKNGIVLDINEAFKKTFGYSKEDIIGKYFSLLFTEEDKGKKIPEKEIEKALQTGSALDNNYIVHKDGSHIWVHGESIYTKDDNGQEFLMKIVQDISEQKKLEAELRQKTEDQKKIINDRNTFVYMASHDLLSPINNIEGLVKYLESGSQNPEEKKFLTQMIYTSIDKFRNTLRDLSQIGHEQEEEKITVVNLELRAMLEEVLFDHKNEIENSKAGIISNFDRAPVVTFSRKNLRSILSNLVSNAIKYRSPDRTPKVIVKSEKLDETYILLTVQDNGLGIKEEDRAKVFGMYNRLHNHVEGSGVGMAIVKRMVENAGGKIELESEVGKGTTFRVYLPL